MRPLGLGQIFFRIGVTAGLCLAIGARRNWARWLYSVLTLLPLLGSLPEVAALTVYIRADYIPERGRPGADTAFHRPFEPVVQTTPAASVDFVLGLWGSWPVRV